MWADADRRVGRVERAERVQQRDHGDERNETADDLAPDDRGSDRRARLKGMYESHQLPP